MNQSDRILELAATTGYHMLYSGGETYRVEDTINRILSSYNMKNINAFTSPTVIIVSCSDEDKTYTKVIRVSDRSANIDMMDKLNQLSRDSKNITIDEFERRLNLIVNDKNLNQGMMVLNSGLVALGFTLFFSGTIFDALYAFGIGVFVRLIKNYFNKFNFNNFVVVSMLSFIITIISLVLSEIHLINSQDTVIIGCLMLLVPGLSITNAIKDFLYNDLVSGTTRAMEAFIVAVFIAVGSGLALTFYTKLIGSLLWF